MKTIWASKNENKKKMKRKNTHTHTRTHAHKQVKHINTRKKKEWMDRRLCVSVWSDDARRARVNRSALRAGERGNDNNSKKEERREKRRRKACLFPA